MAKICRHYLTLNPYIVLLLWDGSCLTSPALRATSPMKGGLGGPYDWHFGQ